jgi:hypothetical protein
VRFCFALRQRCLGLLHDRSIDSIRFDRLRSNCRQFASYPPSGFIVDVGIGEDLQRQARQPPSQVAHGTHSRTVCLRAVGSAWTAIFWCEPIAAAALQCWRRLHASLLHSAALPSGRTNGNAIDCLCLRFGYQIRELHSLGFIDAASRLLVVDFALCALPLPLPY